MKSIPRQLFVALLATACLSPSLTAQESPESGGVAAEPTDAAPAPAETTAAANSAAVPVAEEPKSPGDKGALRFSFAGTSWPQVLEWFAEEADLALQLDQTPSGSFTFADPTRTYSVSEALDVINLALMKNGYTLVRRGRMLQVIDLELENADKLISEIAELVAPEDLDERGRSDVVSCVFPLGSMTPTDAREELAQMIGPWGRVIVLDSARQVKVTEAAGKLLAIRKLLESAAQADTNVVEIVLKHRSADELLELARPLLGLESGENANEEIRISVGLFGDRVYAAGLPGKTGLLKSIFDKADQPLAVPEDGSSDVALPVFRTHTVKSADTSTVFDVLQTLLSGTPDARLAIDPKTNAIIAWARPETHTLIDSTITEMEGNGTSFKVIDLKRLDPAQALLTINKFFGVTEDNAVDGPIVDGDPATGKLWVRGTGEQIKLIEQLLTELEGRDALGGLGDKVRLLPYTGSSAENALQQIETLWPVTGRQNRIRTFTPNRSNPESGGSIRSGMPERRVPRVPDTRVPDARTNPPSDTTEASIRSSRQYHLVSDQNPAPTDDETSASGNSTQATAPSPAGSASEGGESLSAAPQNEESSPSVRLNVDGADIVVQMTPAGLLIASEDVEALDAFQSLLESLATPSAAQSDLPTIIWLKYIKADVAAELVAKVLGGGESSISSAVDSVASGLGGGMLGLLGGFGGGGGGGEASSARSILTSTGSVNIVPDARLNALIVQANAVDMQMIELILEKVDIQESPEDVETVAKPALIPVIYQNASDVADVVKSVFADRIQGSNNNARGGGGGGGGQPSPEDFINALRGAGRGGRGGSGNSATSEPAKISIAVDTKSNSLVVIATPQDFEEVRALVQALDYSSQPSEEVVEIAPLRGDVNPEVIKLALESILGQQTRSTRDSASSSSSGSSSGGDNGSQSSASDIQRRIEAFRAMRDSGGSSGGFRGFGGGTPGGFRGFGGGAPGGGGPTGGFPGFGGGAPGGGGRGGR